MVDTWEGSAGGVASGRRFVEALRRRHDVTVVAADAPGPGPGTVALPRFHLPLVAGIMRANGFAFAVPRRRTLEALFRRVDVVHVQFPFWLGIRAVAIARETGTPVVSAFHVQPENVLYNLGVRSPRLVEAAYRFALRRFFERSDAVVCPSPFALEALRARGLTVAAEVVSNGVAPGLEPAPQRQPGGDGREVLVLVAGRLSREKRVDVAIEAVRRSRHAAAIQLVITGRGPEERAIRKLAATLPRPARVGFVSADELRRLLRAADLLLHPSEVELEGMAVLEALASGTPALLARAPSSAARQFAIGEDFLFAPGDAGELARRMDDLIANPARLREARAACVVRAREYRFEDSVARLEALYARVVAGALVAAPG